MVFEQVDAAPALFAAELRSRDTQTLTLVTAELPTGRIRSKTVPALPFHSALVGIWAGQALYHRFDNPRLPVPTALGNLDLQTGRPRWEWPQHHFIGADAERVWAQRSSLADTTLSPVRAFRLADGEPLETAEKPPVVHNARLHYPVSYTTASTWWPVFDRFIKKNMHHQALATIDYLELGDKLFFLYYYREATDQLRSALLITDRQPTIWLHQNTGPNPDDAQSTPEPNTQPSFGNGSFCVWQNQIIFQPIATCITSYYLTPLP
ncbi:hypothetical protein [Larkinella sp. VNQ87]|uniref:hypothetical protein n=1 Tax=Larkinella sp. VNQ87 TaxID=3400921 RepID=UPI003C2E919B